MNGRGTARCLDLSRLVSRVRRGPLTGVDRVERAYLDHLLTLPDPLFSLVKMRWGFALLDREGTEQLAACLDGSRSWGLSDLRARMTPRLNGFAQNIDTALRRMAIAHCLRPALAKMLEKHLPAGVRYLNTGHSNMSERVLDAVQAVPHSKISVLIHDMIPLDHPKYQRLGTRDRFEEMMFRIAAVADLVIYNSAQTKRDAETYFTRWGRVPDSVVAHLGVEMPTPVPEEIPGGLPLDRPYFVIVGTIEPRKNHGFLLDIWEDLAEVELPESIPPLIIVGRRGWATEDFFARLDAHPLRGTSLYEINNLSDGGMAALVDGAAGLLFPSFAEGFGLPPVEAAALGTPVLCGKLDIYREVLGDYPIYASVNDQYQWTQAVREMATKKTAKTAAITPPQWDDHFNRVLSLT